MIVRKIYFDMDDTIADFGRGVNELCHMELPEQGKASEAEDDKMWAAIREVGDFYYQLKECTPGAVLFRALRELYGSRVEILTAIPKPKRHIDSAEADKKRWVAEHFGEDVVVNIAHSADEKKLLAKDRYCFLVDDLEKNIKDWQAAGTAVLFLKKDLPATELQIENSGLLNASEEDKQRVFQAMRVGVYNSTGSEKTITDYFRKNLNDEDLEYYRNNTFARMIPGEAYNRIISDDEDIPFRLEARAITDINCHNPVRALNDFSDASEYNYYLGVLYEYALMAHDGTLH